MKRIVVGAWRLAAGFAVPSKARNLRRLRERGEKASAFRIREATAADVPALTRLHVTTWNATYAPLLMKGPGYEVRERQWREAFGKNQTEWFCFVVERPDGELVAFAQGNRSDHPEFAGHLNKIYVLREYQRLGIGRRLLGHVARRFRSLGMNSMWLLVTRGIPQAECGQRWVPGRQTRIQELATTAGVISPSWLRFRIQRKPAPDRHPRRSNKRLPERREDRSIVSIEHAARG